MAKIPMRFKRVTAAFDELARARLCESSGSENSVDNSADLSDLIDSFMECDDRIEGDENEGKMEERNEFESENFWPEADSKEMLQSLLDCDKTSGNDEVKRSIREETELAYRVIGKSSSSEGLKRLLMNRLRKRGFNAGLCKSRWEKNGHFPAGEYEYIDIIVSGTRYVVEVSLAGEFKIARPTNRYLSLLDIFPQIFVGNPEELKQIVRLMSTAAKESMKSRDLLLPPWRRKGYMMAKWFSSYKRTTNSSPTRKSSDSGEGLAGKRLIGFETSLTFQYCNCRNVLAKNGVGNLAAALNGMHS